MKNSETTYRKTNTIKTLALSAFVALVASLQPADASVLINVDIQVDGGINYVGLGAIRPAGSGTTWNAFDIPAGGANPPNGESMLNLVDEHGAATTVNVAFGTLWTGTFNDTDPNTLQRDRAYTAGADLATFTISGLVDGGGTTYNVALIGSGNLVTDFTIGGTTLTATGGSADAAFVDGVSHVYFSDLTATGGEITFTTRANGGPNGALAGLQIQAIVIPEPSTLALLGTGLGMLLLARRRNHLS